MSREIKAVAWGEPLRQTALCKQPTQIHTNANALQAEQIQNRLWYYLTAEPTFYGLTNE